MVSRFVSPTVESRSRDIDQIVTRDNTSRKHVCTRPGTNTAPHTLGLAGRSVQIASDVHKGRVKVVPGTQSAELLVVTWIHTRLELQRALNTSGTQGTGDIVVKLGVVVETVADGLGQVSMVDGSEVVQGVAVGGIGRIEANDVGNVLLA